MGKQLRVHILAKELNVSSKMILEKCAAEGIELPNHMAVVSAGLAESIREWFSVGDDITSVEEAAPVDLTKIRRPRRPAANEADQSEESGTDTAVAELPEVAAHEPEGEFAVAEAAPPAAEAPAPVEPERVEPEAPAPPPLEVAPPRVVEAPAPPPVTVHAPAPAPIDMPPSVTPPQIAPVLPPAPQQRPAPAQLRPAAVVAPVAPPADPVRPAGPQLVPKPAELQGPRVVRREAPDPVRPPRPRPGGPMGPGGPGPGYGPDSRGRGPGPGPGPGAGGGLGAPPARRGKEEDRDRKPSRSPRRQGTGTDVIDRLREWRDQDVLERKERLASATGTGLRDRRAAERRRQTSPTSGPVARKSEVELTEPFTLKEFCSAVGVSFGVVASKLMQHTGKMATNINQTLDAETAELVALDLGVSIRLVKAKTLLEKLDDEVTARERKNLERRPPVVAMLGHVDHGKTSLLDAIRDASVAKGEAGGITQHIGAYRIDRGDWHVTFLDTPGHEAFTSMRARGANLTDVVVLVVAADDGVMPQTVEALNHARAAGVQIVVALNKSDLPHDLNRIYGQLTEHQLTPTEWGGNTDVIKTAATARIGIDELVAHLSTLSELLDLKADPTVPALAVVIEAKMREGRGNVAQVLVREGTLRVGQAFVCGPASGRIRSLIDDRGQRITEAGPGTPVEVVGLDDLPRAGDKLYVLDDLSRAKLIATETQQARRTESLRAVRKPQTLEDLLRGGAEDEIPELNIIVKADGQASIDALRGKLAEFPEDKARLRVLHAGVGAVSEADVMLAHTSSAVIFGFYVVADDRAKSMADQLGVEIRTYRVIYEILEDVQRALEGLLEPTRTEEVRGKAEVLQIFNISRLGLVAGCRVVDGIIARSHRARLVRDGRIIKDNATIDSLRRVKDDAREVRAGLECGIKLENFDDIKPGDVIETFEVVETAQRL